jgi:hypothetical protein
VQAYAGRRQLLDRRLLSRRYKGRERPHRFKRFKCQPGSHSTAPLVTQSALTARRGAELSRSYRNIFYAIRLVQAKGGMWRGTW